MRIKIFFLIVFFIFSLNSVFAQINETLNFEPLETNIGTRAISCIVKDHKGIIWIGTQGNGLSSFNDTKSKTTSTDGMTKRQLTILLSM